MKLLLTLFVFAATSAFAQNASEEQLLAYSQKACECISQISNKSDKKNNDIKNCIESSVDESINDADLEGIYAKIESVLVQRCEPLKQLAFTENKNFKHASSENVLAQLAYDDGMEYIKEGDIDSAIEKFQRAVEIDPNFAFAWDNLGISYRKKKDYNKAIESYLKSLTIYPEGRLPLLNIAITYNLNKQYEEAIVYYQKFIDFYQDDPEGYYGLGLILYTQDKQEEGLDNLIRAYTIYTAQNSPYRADAAKKIGYMYKDLKNKDQLDIFHKVADKYNLKVENN